MTEAVIQEVKAYVDCFENEVAQFISTMPIMDLFLEVGQSPGERVSKQWWLQEDLELVGILTAAQREKLELEEREREDIGVETVTSRGKGATTRACLWARAHPSKS